MHDTEFNQKLAQLCRERPDFSRRLAAEYKSLQKKEAGIYEDYMSWQALHKIMDRVPALLALLKETNQDLEDWQESQIQLASEYLDSVYDALQFRPDTGGE
jgi:hypothetical protein